MKLPKRRVLVVDDNKDSALSLAMLLRVMGNETQVAHDGLEAIAAAESFQPDIILLDIGLPKLNGYDAARCIRQTPAGEAMTLVAVTGRSLEEDQQKSLDAGFDVHLVKPIEHRMLEQLLANLHPV